MFDFDYARQVMVDRHLIGRGIGDGQVLEAMRQVPREKFVTAGMEEFAYEDSPLAIGEDQTISQPYIVARMIEATELEAGDRVLEVGTGSGYAAAVMSRVARRIFTVERRRTLGEQARARLETLGYGNVSVRIGDGSAGWPEAPFDAILVAAGGPAIPMVLQEQLEIGGRLVMPVGKQEDYQRLIRLTRVSASRYEEEDLGGVLFVPLIGEHGWSGEADSVASVDARHTEMGQSRDELNIGQLCREHFGNEAALIGFGTHSGTVAAATDWDGEMEIKTVRPSSGDTVEHCFHLTGHKRGLLDFAGDKALSAELARERLERFIGVIYRPETERYSHYALASLSQQFDAYVWFDNTSAVTPLKAPAGSGQVAVSPRSSPACRWKPRAGREVLDEPPPASAPCAWNTFFAISRPIVVTSDMGASSSGVFNTSTLAHRCRRGRPPHHPSAAGQHSTHFCRSHRSFKLLTAAGPP